MVRVPADSALDMRETVPVNTLPGISGTEIRASPPSCSPSTASCGT